MAGFVVFVQTSAVLIIAVIIFNNVFAYMILASRNVSIGLVSFRDTVYTATECIMKIYTCIVVWTGIQDFCNGVIAGDVSCQL